MDLWVGGGGRGDGVAGGGHSVLAYIPTWLGNLLTALFLEAIYLFFFCSPMYVPACHILPAHLVIYSLFTYGLYILVLCRTFRPTLSTYTLNLIILIYIDKMN